MQKAHSYGCWLETSVLYHVGFFLECLSDITICFHQSELFKRETDQDGSCTVFSDLKFKQQTMTPTLFFLLEVSH